MTRTEPNLSPRQRAWRRRAAAVPRRALVLTAVLLAIGATHWLVPVEPEILQLLHVVMRKLFILPVVLGAIWFGMRGALVAAAGTTLIYLPHVLLQWAGYPQENASQLGDLAVVWTVATLAGWLVGRERAALEESARAHEGALHALVAALDAREHGTEMHSQRVRAYARRILDQLNPTRAAVRILEEGALLHDIGKIGVPDHILLKPGPLTIAEWRVMRRHPEIGRNILHATRLARESIEIVWLHHERYDGGGYPLGLSGSEIPPLVRVFAVADAFDAITSARHYKDAQTMQVARERIEEASGSHFDPIAVEAFLSVPTKEWLHIAHRFGDEPAGAGQSPDEHPAEAGTERPMNGVSVVSSESDAPSPAQDN